MTSKLIERNVMKLIWSYLFFQPRKLISSNMPFAVLQALVIVMHSRRLLSKVQEPDCIRSNIPQNPPFDQNPVSSANVSKSATPRPGFYAGCTREELVSILYPLGRESTVPTGPSLPTSHRAASKRNRLGGLVKSVTGLFRKGKAFKFKSKETTSTIAKPLPAVAELRSSGVMFDASEELDRCAYHAIAGLGSSLESSDALNELIDAHSDRDPGSDLGSDSDSFSSLADIIAKFPAVPTTFSSTRAPRVGRPGCSSDILDGFVIGGRVVSVNRSAGPRQDSVSNNTRRSAAPSVPFFERRPSSGEFNRIDVFKQVSAAIQKRRIRPLRLMSKVKESTAPGPSEVSLAPVQTRPTQRCSAAALQLVPDLVVTNHDDSTTVVVGLDEDQEPADHILPGLLFPGYVRRHYPGDGQLAGPPHLTLSTNGWNISLQAIDEEDEETVDSCFPDDDSEPDLELVSDSGLSSPESTPPTTPTTVDTPLLAPTTVGVASKFTHTKNWMVVDDDMDENRDDAVGIAL
ncbi:hypothetical protein FRC06_009588 [Ceratobasidium sp. 370]|nr:hypothetical protein FRC06_009588 [Ceratobasidium sp. 370]